MSGKKPNGKNKGGRPSKLTAELCKKLDQMIEEWNPLRQRSDRKKLDEFLRLCTKDNLAYALGICRDTLNEYERGSGEYSDIIKSNIESWETRRNAFFTMTLPCFENAAEWIFLSKNFLKFTDTVRIGNIEGESLMIEARRRLTQMGPLKVAASIARARAKIEDEDNTH